MGRERKGGGGPAGRARGTEGCVATDWPTGDGFERRGDEGRVGYGARWRRAAHCRKRGHVKVMIEVDPIKAARRRKELA